MTARKNATYRPRVETFSVLQRPVVSEKSTLLREAARQYQFDVHARANKEDVRQAIYAMFGVMPTKVRTAIRRGKIKRRGMILSRPKSTKRATVTLREGDKLPLFDDE